MKRNNETEFLSLISKSEDKSCWLWTGSTNKNGYGTYKFMGESLSHRIVYKLVTKEEITGFAIRHSCDNPPCCNPNHLIKGTQLDNIKDMDDRNRRNISGIINQVGSNNPSAIYSEELILKIIDHLCSGSFTVSRVEIAEKFNVPVTLVYDLAKGKAWSHLPRPKQILRGSGNSRFDSRMMAEASYMRDNLGMSYTKIGKCLGMNRQRLKSAMDRFRIYVPTGGGH